jgi:predicted MPP superfamily phosphohydrolase
MKWVAAACDILAELRKPTVVTFGNHDYAEHREPWEGSEIADALQARLESHGITVLRNRAIPIERDGARIWIVGLEDFWSAKFSPHEAFAPTKPDEPIIALSHNPDSIFALEHFGAQWVLAGHTHGGQIRIPVAGPIILPVRHKQFDQGLFHVGNSFLYVCRGVGFRLQVRFRCRPEVASFVLQRHR